MFCKFRVLVLPYIPYFRTFRVFRHSVPSFRQSTIPPNRVTPTRGSLVSFHLSTLNNNDLTDYKGYMGSRNKQVYFLIMYYHFSTLRYRGFSYRVPPGQVRTPWTSQVVYEKHFSIVPVFSSIFRWKLRYKPQQVIFQTPNKFSFHKKRLIIHLT